MQCKICDIVALLGFLLYVALFLPVRLLGGFVGLFVHNFMHGFWAIKNALLMRGL